jgi:hypothetical protein
MCTALMTRRGVQAFTLQPCVESMDAESSPLTAPKQVTACKWATWTQALLTHTDAVTTAVHTRSGA